MGNRQRKEFLKVLDALLHLCDEISIAEETKIYCTVKKILAKKEVKNAGDKETKSNNDWAW